MKKSILLLATIAVLATCLPVTAHAATQVYDLKADWSNTQNPNGPWAYRQGDSLLIGNPFPWVGSTYTGCPDSCSWPPSVPVIEKVTGTVQAYAPFLQVADGFLEAGDVLVVPGFGGGGNILWTAPESGTIDISGATWLADVEYSYCGPAAALWKLSLNGGFLSGGDSGPTFCDYNPRGSPYDLSFGSGGTAALQNISVQEGDQVVLAFSGYPIGLNFTVTLTADSVDPLAAIEDLATTVIEMNLQNGIENSLDSKLDAALDALIDVNVNNDGAACNSLQAFINAVEAQRGKKLTSTQANQLIASAQQIQAMLNCGD